MTMQVRAVSPLFGLVIMLAAAACSDSGANGASGGAPSSAGAAGLAGAASSGAAGVGAAGAAGSSSGAAGMSAGSGGTGGSLGGGGGAAMVGCTVPPATEMQPAMLSQTGCVNMAEPGKPAPGLIPYDVRSPLWSDGASKQRFLRIPDGGKIHVLDCAARAADCNADTANGDDGHWEVPVGSVLVKNFSIEDKIIETRLIMRRSMTKWLFYGYEWNDAGTEATLLPDDNLGKDRPVGSGSQVWHYPGRGQCPQCHTPGSGFSLGPSTPQMNTDFAYADGTLNQVEKFKQLDLFDAPPKAMDGYPNPFGSDSLELRARSYLQTNCAICHRPSGEYSGMDMRWGKPIADMKICDVSERDAGKVPKYRVVPGKPLESNMSFRMSTLEPVRMPKVGSIVVDPNGSKLIDDWIAAMPANVCPPQQ